MTSSKLLALTFFNVIFFTDHTSCHHRLLPCWCNSTSVPCGSPGSGPPGRGSPSGSVPRQFRGPPPRRGLGPFSPLCPRSGHPPCTIDPRPGGTSCQTCSNLFCTSLNSFHKLDYCKSTINCCLL